MKYVMWPIAHVVAFVLILRVLAGLMTDRVPPWRGPVPR